MEELITADIAGWIARLRSYFLSEVLTAAGELAAAERVCAAGLAQSREAGDLWNQVGLLPKMATSLAAVRGAGPPGPVVASPYRGLSVFEEQDAAFFFGREAATAAVLERMSRLVGDPGLLVVSGVSGAGKSSLLRAGVLPRIREAGLAAAPEAMSWPLLVFTPTRAPLD